MLLSTCSFLKFFCPFNSLSVSDYSSSPRQFFNLPILLVLHFSEFNPMEFLVHITFPAEVIPFLFFSFYLNVGIHSYISNFDLPLELQTYLLAIQ